MKNPANFWLSPKVPKLVLFLLCKRTNLGTLGLNQKNEKSCHFLAKSQSPESVLFLWSKRTFMGTLGLSLWKFLDPQQQICSLGMLVLYHANLKLMRPYPIFPNRWSSRYVPFANAKFEKQRSRGMKAIGRRVIKYSGPFYRILNFTQKTLLLFTNSLGSSALESFWDISP